MTQGISGLDFLRGQIHAHDSDLPKRILGTLSHNIEISKGNH